MSTTYRRLERVRRGCSQLRVVLIVLLPIYWEHLTWDTLRLQSLHEKFLAHPDFAVVGIPSAELSSRFASRSRSATSSGDSTSNSSNATTSKTVMDAVSFALFPPVATTRYLSLYQNVLRFAEDDTDRQQTVLIRNHTSSVEKALLALRTLHHIEFRRPSPAAVEAEVGRDDFVKFLVFTTDRKELPDLANHEHNRVEEVAEEEEAVLGRNGDDTSMVYHETVLALAPSLSYRDIRALVGEVLL
eukprot:TRINITY_DN17343_c0_g1_i1.p1 TRINITY_DN17343_c0_g1~~TRINITY_DN17343_c0_g1_i1.p1  ORF type:complete len:244 (+),score=36.55 TRINITY_DN17343_c0_g1_i1:432-1163(+)